MKNTVKKVVMILWLLSCFGFTQAQSADARFHCYLIEDSIQSSEDTRFIFKRMDLDFLSSGMIDMIFLSDMIVGGIVGKDRGRRGTQASSGSEVYYFTNPKLLFINHQGLMPEEVSLLFPNDGNYHPVDVEKQETFTVSYTARNVTNFHEKAHYGCIRYFAKRGLDRS